MFKSRLAGLLSTLIISSSSAALANTQAPLTCPSVGAIMAAGLSTAEEFSPNQYIVYNQSHYDTQNNWVMALGFIRAGSEEQALAKANKLLPYLSGNPIPKSDLDWVCEYNPVGRVTALASLVPIFQLNKFHKL